MEARHYRLNLNNKILMLFIVRYYANNIFSLKNNDFNQFGLIN